jgi:osmotically-inducible protein OsmY
MKKSKLALLAMLALPIMSTAIITSCASTHNEESTGQYVDSSAVTLKVKADLLANKSMKSLPITVNTYKDGVQLSGYVDTAYQKVKAGDIASRVEGVRSVDNQLIVKTH